MYSVLGMEFHFTYVRKTRQWFFKKFIEMLRVIIQMWKSCMSSFNCLYCYTWQRFDHQCLHLSLEKHSNTLEIGIGVVLCTVIAHRALEVTWALALWLSLCLVLVLSCAGPCGKASARRVSLLGAGKTFKRWTLVWDHWQCTFKGNCRVLRLIFHVSCFPGSPCAKDLMWYGRASVDWCTLRCKLTSVAKMESWFRVFVTVAEIWVLLLWSEHWKYYALLVICCECCECLPERALWVRVLGRQLGMLSFCLVV